MVVLKWTEFHLFRVELLRNARGSLYLPIRAAAMHVNYPQYIVHYYVGESNPDAN